VRSVWAVKQEYNPSSFSGKNTVTVKLHQLATIKSSARTARHVVLAVKVVECIVVQSVVVRAKPDTGDVRRIEIDYDVHKLMI
jgi:hypothetical protein